MKGFTACTKSNEMTAYPQKLTLSQELLAVVRLEPHSEIPSWALENKGFTSITRTKDELSIVCLESQIPKDTKMETGYQALKIQGPLDFGLTGILASIANPLAKAQISIFAVSTFDTDYVLIKKEKMQDAVNALRSAGHFIE